MRCRAAIVGAGFAGSAIAYFLHRASLSLLPQEASVDLTIFSSDLHEPASVIAGGLLHPFVGARSDPSEHNGVAFTWYEEARSLMQCVWEEARTLPGACRPFFRETPLLKPLLDRSTAASFRDRTPRYADHLTFLEECGSYLPPDSPACRDPAILIHRGISVNARLYLQSIHDILRFHGARFVRKTISSVEKDLSRDFDLVFLACGHGFRSVQELQDADLPLNTIKGQLMEFSVPSQAAAAAAGITLPSVPVVGRCYLNALPSSDILIGGSTFEPKFTTCQVERNQKTADLEQGLSRICPSMLFSPPEAAAAPATTTAAATVPRRWQAGIRCAPKHGHFPIAKRLEPRRGTFVLVGLGSRGLLMHAYYARRLVTDALLACPQWPKEL